MPTTPYLPPPPTTQGSNLSAADHQWLLIAQNLAPLYEVDTSAGSYAEDPPPAGVETSGQSGQCKEITYVKTSSDANTYTLNGVEGGPYTLTKQFQSLKIKSDGTNWWPSENPASSGGGGVAVGTNVTPLPAQGTTFPGTSIGTANSMGATNTFVQYIPANSLLAQPQKWTVEIETASPSTTVTMQIVACTPGTGNVVATANITFGGLTSPTLAPAGLYTSDAIAFPLSSAFDYYILLNSSTGLIKLTEPGTAQAGSAGGVYVESSNMIGTNPLTFTGGTLEAGKALTFSFQAA
jgi:hypothetical protein